MHDKSEKLQYPEPKKEVRRAKRFERNKKKVLVIAFYESPSESKKSGTQSNKYLMRAFSKYCTCLQEVHNLSERMRQPQREVECVKCHKRYSKA